MLVGWNKPGHLCARGRSVHASSMSQRRFVVSFGSWNIQSSSYSSAGSRRPYWQPLGSGARITEGSRGMPLRFSLPLVPLSGSSGSCRLPHSMLTLGSFVRPIPILPRGLSCNSLAVLTLLPVPLSEKPAVKFHLLPGQLSSLLHGQQQPLHFPLSFSHFFSLFSLFLQSWQVSSGAFAPCPSPSHSGTSGNSSHAHSDSLLSAL